MVADGQIAEFQGGHAAAVEVRGADGDAVVEELHLAAERSRAGSRDRGGQGDLIAVGGSARRNRDGGRRCRRTAVVARVEARAFAVTAAPAR